MSDARDLRKQAQRLVDLGAKATTHHGTWVADKTNGKGEPVLSVIASEGGIVCKVQTARFEPATYHNAEFIAACGNHAPGIAIAYLEECEAHERTKEAAKLLAQEILNAHKVRGHALTAAAGDVDAVIMARDFLASIEQKEDTE